MSLVEENYEGATNPAFTTVFGEVGDGPTPETTVKTALAAPSDATPGCVVYAVKPPDCVDIGGCSIQSDDAECAAAAKSGVNPCVCVAKDKCRPYPTKKDVGSVTVNGVGTTAGADRFELENQADSYQVKADTTLAHPGFREGETIRVSATGGDYEAFEVSAPAITPFRFTNAPFHLNRDPASTDTTKYQALTIEWNPPESATASRVTVDLNLSLHAGTVGILWCDVEDTGSLTISAGQISQLAGLGNIGGLPELTVTRITTGTVDIALGRVELLVMSESVRFPIVEGYTSCERPSDCDADQICNTAIKLCETA
ncbi:hypothetical protein ACFL5O_07220 [Myxococcota bacterium]